MKSYKVNEVVDSISITHKFDKPFLYAINTSDILEGNLLTPPLLPVEDLKGQFKKTIKKGDILFSEIRPANNRYALVDWNNCENYVVSTKLMVLRKFNNKVDLKYFYYWLTNKQFLRILQNRAENRICSFPQITFDLLSEYSLPIVPLDLQKKISDFIFKIDSKIKLNNKINDELESMAKTLYDYWFLQFEFPNEEGKPYKSSGGKMVWNKELKREIPEGWEVGTLSQIANITMGSSPKGESLNDEKQGIIFYQGKTDFGFRFPVTRMYTTSPVKCANIGDILLSVRAPVGSMNIANEKCCIGRGLAAISGKCKSFLYYMMLANQFQFDKYNNGGTTFGAITKDDLFGLKIIVPNNKIIQRFNDKICHMDKLIEKNEKENQELADLRDFLLPLLMNGQVGFKE